MQVAKVKEIDINKESYYTNLSDIYKGDKATAHLFKEPLEAEAEKRFKNNCVRFLVELCNQFKKRFTFDSDSLIAKLNVLDPNASLQENYFADINSSSRFLLSVSSF